MDTFIHTTSTNNIGNGYSENNKTITRTSKLKPTEQENNNGTSYLQDNSFGDSQITVDDSSFRQSVPCEISRSSTSNLRKMMPRYKLNLRFANTGDILKYNVDRSAKINLGYDSSLQIQKGQTNCTFYESQEKKNNLESEIQKIEHALGQRCSEEKQCKVLDEKLTCEKHSGCELTHICRKCEVAICQHCRSSLEHKGHRTKRIKIAIEERKNELKNKYITNEREKHQKLRRNLKSVENEKANVRTSCDEVVARIRQRCVYMKNILDTVANNLVKDVYYKKRDCIQQFTSVQKELQSELERSECNLQFMNDLYETTDERHFLQEYKEMKQKSITEIKIPNIWKEYVSFKPGGLSAEELKERFGTVNFVVATDGGAFTYENKQQYGRLSCRSKTSFKCERRSCLESDEDEQDSGPINAIAKTTDKLWVICGINSRQLSLLDEDGKTLKTLRLKMKVEDITLLPDGDIIFSVFRDKALRKVSVKGEVSDILKLPYNPKGIAISKDRGYLVCMCDSYSTSVCEDSRRIVVKYSNQGEEERVYEYNEDARLFTRPFRVAENSNGDICVIDKTSMGSGQVVIMDQTGLVKTVYQGGYQGASEFKNKTVTSFAPCDIACDRNGKIFIAESDNHKIHLLNKEGSYIGHFLTSESDFFCPQTITSDVNKHIWVGNEYGEIKMFTCDWQ